VRTAARREARRGWRTPALRHPGTLAAVDAVSAGLSRCPGRGYDGGPAVTSIVSVDASTAMAEPAGRFEPDRGRGQRRWGHAEPVEEHHGSVKFYNAAKGYGFVVPDDGGPDVFVPGIVLNRAGLGGLETGQQVSVMVEQGARGLQARDIEVI